MSIYILIYYDGEIQHHEVFDYTDFDQVMEFCSEAVKVYGNQPDFCFEIFIL